MSNFWKEFSFPSPVDDILKKPHFTLEELLDEDDVVVDIRSQKEELKEYLTKGETLKALLQYIVEEAPEGVSEAVQFRYPVVACEILTAEVDEIERELVGSPELLDSLFGFFSTVNVNVLLANLVIRTIGTLMNTRLSTLLDYMKAKPEFLEHIVSHIDCAAVPEFIIRLINMDADYEGKGTLQWLVEKDFVRTMVSKFSPEHERLQSDLARTLIEIIVTSSESSPLLQKLYTEDTLDLLLEQILKPGNTYGFRAGMAVISQLLRALGSQMHDSEMTGHVPVPHDATLESLPLVVRTVVAVLPRLSELLVAPPKTRVITNQLGKEVEAFGFYRLAILQCFECLLSLGYSNLLKELMINHVEMYRNFFELIFKFSTNNFCPIFVERIFAASLSLSANDDVVEFVKKLEMPTVILQKEAEVKNSGFMGMPFFRRIIYNLADRQRRTEQLEVWLSGVAGWEDLLNSLAEEFAEMDHRTGYGDMGSDSHSNEQMSLSEESVESSNDADDYDTQRAEVLTSKAHIDGLF